MCHRIGRPPIGTIGLGRNSVSSRKRVPSPPQRITTCIRGSILSPASDTVYPSEDGTCERFCCGPGFSRFWKMPIPVQTFQEVKQSRSQVGLSLFASIHLPKEISRRRCATGRVMPEKIISKWAKTLSKSKYSLGTFWWKQGWTRYSRYSASFWSSSMIRSINASSSSKSK